MFDYKIVDNQELSNISGGGLGGDVVVGALSGAFQAGQSCIILLLVVEILNKLCTPSQ